MEKREPLCMIGGTIIGANTIENSMMISQKIKNRTTIWSSNSTSKYLSKDSSVPRVPPCHLHIFGLKVHGFQAVLFPVTQWLIPKARDGPSSLYVYHCMWWKKHTYLPMCPLTLLGQPSVPSGFQGAMRTCPSTGQFSKASTACTNASSTSVWPWRPSSTPSPASCPAGWGFIFF